MTQPDGFFPDNAFNLDSLAELAARPQSEWEAMIRGQTSGGFETFLSALFGSLPADLREGIEFTRAVVTAIIRQILNLPGQIWDSVEDALAALAGWVADIPIIGDILTIINDTFSAIFGGIDFTGTLPTPGEVWQTVINTLMLPLNLLLGPNSALNAANLFGWLPQIDLSSIGQFSPNLLSEGDFLDSVVVAPNTGFTVVGGAAVVTADGADHVLISEIIPVTKNQQIWAGASAKYASATGAANSVLVELVALVKAPAQPSGYAPVSTVTLGTLTPSGTAPDWSVLSNELSKYTVPDGVDGVAVRLHVTPDALTGTISFKAAFLKKTQKLPIPFVGELPETLQAAAARVQSIIDRIINAFENLGEFVDGEHDVEDVLGAIFGIFDVGLGARTKAAAIEARVRQLESAANSIVLDFAGSSSTTLSGWTVVSSGGGAGAMGPDGKGNLVWHPSGVGNRTQLGRYDLGSLTVDNGHMEWILSSSPQSYIFDDAWTYVLFRMQDTANCTRIRSGFGEIRIQAVVAGAVTNIGLPWSGNPKAGDQFALDFGEAAGANKRHFVLSRNGAPILDVTDSGNVSQVGAAFHKIGAGMETGNRLVFFQNIPAGLGVLTASEVL
ncbi:hypothetical protein ACNQR7_02555 [Mycolicibacterium senegalense]|uniref:DUF7257 domain-containing protein n=1 Tax=Mycolicibacterium senegalense TaxID=1796 RepID=UPI003AB07B6E